MLLFEADIAWNAIKGWVLNQYLNQKELLVYDVKATNKAFIESIVPSNNDDVSYNKLLRCCSINNLFRLIDQKRFEEIREILRDYIWEAIEKDNILGISFLFNFDDFITKNKFKVFNLEKILKDLFQNRFGFPIDCCCLYPSSIDVLEFAELVDLHNGYQIFDKYQQLRLKHHLYTKQTMGRDYKETEIENSQKSFGLDDSLPHVARRAFSDSNSPFYFCKGEEVIGVVKNLANFYKQLKEVPLDVFCFHCYRMSRSNLAGKSISPSPRSDIALWIEYSLGDTELAHRIFNTIRYSLGDGLKTLESASKFTQLTIKSSVLELIKSRIRIYEKNL